MRNIDGVIEANKAANGTFFNRRTVLYFSNKVLPTMYGGLYFISYDLTENGKRFTVRKVLASGKIGRVGVLHAYESKAAAVIAIRELLAAVVTA